ncbi:MAG: 16S rRNA processing protein RimM [Nitrospirales bacterium]|nr:16S rRNA processing protein RimM [Nitrospirales bacterium]
MPEGDSSLVAIGRVLKEWGIRGEFLVIPMTFDPERFLDLSEIVMGDVPGALRKIRSVRFHKDLILMGIEGCSTPEDARKLRGALLRIEKGESPPLPEGTYYHYQIIGLEVYTTDGRCLGRVESIMETKGNDIYVVKGDGGEHLIPSIRDWVRKIDLEEGRMVVEPMDTVED